jgi:GAF domain-containing protein/CheY-like chemotaxis protein
MRKIMRNKICLRLLLVISFTAIFVSAVAQNESEKGLPFITNYTPKIYGGGPGNWSIIEDNDGIMYFGQNKTKSNLLQYDGVKWTIIPCPPSSVVCRSLAKDKSGIIYYGGLGDFGYLDKDRLGAMYEHSLLKFVPKDKRNFTDVWTIQITDKGIYFQSRDWLFRLTKKDSGNNESWIVKTWQPATHFMFTFYEDSILYIHQQGRGLLKMQNDSLVLIPGSEFLGEDRMQVMLPYANNAAQNNLAVSKQYLIGTFTHGMYVFDGKNFKPFKSEADSLIRNYQLYKGIVFNGNYALSLLGYGLVVINPQGKIVQVINQVNSGLQGNIIYAMYADSKGSVWLSLDNGISKLELNSPFTVFNTQNGINATPLSVARIPNGELYVGTNNSLLQFNQSTSKFETNSLIPHDQIFTLLKDGNTLLVPGNGLHIIKGGKVILVQPSVNNNLKISALAISKKYPNILFAGTSFGIALFIRDASNIKGWKYLGYLPGFKGELFLLAEDEEGSIWTVTSNGTAYRITISVDEYGNPDISKTRVENFGPKQGLKQFLVNVFAINKKIYLGSDSTTYTFNKEKNNFEVANFQGMHNFNAVEDSTGKLWIGAGTTDNIKYLIAKSEPGGNYQLDSTSLLPVINQSISNLYPDKNGIVWLITNDALIRYDQKIKINANPSYKTLIRSVAADKQKLNPNLIAGANFPEIKHNNNSLRFEYAAPFYEQEDKTQYQTWLEGFEKTWSDWGKNTYKEYTNLSAGKYKFHVRAKNLYHKISEEAAYSFIILAPWYGTWWAYLLYALAGIFLIYLFIKWRTRQLEEKHRELEKTIKERTAQLSDRVEELAVINNVQEGLVSKLDMQSIYDLVGNKIRDAFDAQVVIIGSFDTNTGLEHFNYTIENGKRYYPGSRPFDKLRKQLIETKQKIVIRDKEEVLKWFGNTSIRDTKPIKSAVFVPLIIGGHVKRYVSLQNVDRENAFGDSQIRLLETLANSMSVALENARLFDETTHLLKETEQRTSELAVINSVQEGLVAQMDIQSIYDLVGEKIRNIFSAQIIDIVTYNKKKNLIEDRYAFEKGDRTLIGPREPLGFRKHVIETRQIFLINEKLDEVSKKYESYVTIGEQPKAAVFVPMITGGEVTGIISLQNLDHENAFSESSVNLLITLANSMSVALKSAGLFDETNRLLKETEQRNAELAVINSVQESLVAKLDMAGIYELVGEKIRQIFGAQVIDIVTYDPSKNIIADQYAYEKGDRTLLGEREPNGFRKHVIKTGVLLLHNEKVEKAMREFGNEILIGDVPKSQIYVPMIADGKVKGIISLQNLDHEHAFSESDVSLLTTLANSMTVALESARLFDETNRLLKETEQRTSELAVINSVQEGLVAQMDMQAIYDLVGEKIRNIFNAQIIDIVTYDKTNNLIEDKYSFEKGDRTLLGPRHPKGFRKHVIESPHVFLINEKMNKLSREYDSYVTIGELPKSAVFVPMITGGEITGIISLQNLDHEHAFSDSDVNLLTTLANSMTVALKSAGLFDETNRLLKETEQRNAELAVINSVQESLVGGMNMAGIYELVGEKMREIFGAQVIDIVTFDANRNVIIDKYSYEKGDRTLVGERKPTGFRKHVIQTGSVLVHNENVDQAMKEYENEIIIGDMPKSQIYVPMIADGRVKGIISLQNLDHEHAFSESDISLLTTLTNSMSVALESARLFDETTRLLDETERRNAELAVINSVQESLVAKMDVEAIYYLVGEKIRDVFNAQVIDITTYDPETNLIEDKYAYEKGDRTLMSKRIPYGFRKHVIETGQMLVINKDMYKQRLIYDNSIVVGKAAKSLVMAPLMLGGKVNGVISLQNLDKENAFSESEISLLSTLVNSMSVALKSARLFDETTRLLKETEQRTAELAVINSVQEGLAKELDMQAIYDLVGERISNVFQAQAMIIASLDQETKTENFNYLVEKGQRFYLEPRPYDKLRQYLIETREKILINSNYKEAALRFGMNVLPGTEHPKSLLFVPLIIGDKVKSYVSLQNVDIENAFSDADVRLLETLANSMSVALENARLFDETNRLLKETEERTAELGVINNVQDGLSRELDPQLIYNLVGDRLCELFPETQTLVIRSFDHNTGFEQFQYTIEKGIKLTVKPQPFIWANKQLIATKKPIHINKDYVETAKKFGGTGVTTGKPPKSAVFVPMIVGDIVIGSISLQNVDRENAFSESNLRLLMTLTNSMSVALENARLFNETTHLLSDAKQRASELSTVNNISKALASQLNPSELIQFVGDQLHDLFRANIVYLALLNKTTNIIEFPYQFGDDMAPLKFGEGLTSKIIKTGESLLINQDVTSKVKEYNLEHIGIPAASYLGVPIPLGEEIIGVLSIQSTEQQNRFNEDDERLLNTIASSVGVALNNAQLFEDVEMAKMEAEKASKIAEKANEAKSAFLSTVSHELRTPLTSVLGFAKIINKRLNDKIFPSLDQTEPKTQKTVTQITENLQVVISEGERLTHLINDVLDLAKIEAGRMEWNQENVSLSEVVERAIAATTSLFEQKTIKLVKKIDPNVPDIIGDPDKLIQVVINLFSNAVKFTEAGAVTCEVSQKQNEVIVSVTDTGIGIAPEDFGAVFEQFKQVGGDTLTDKPKGTGLGLPICKEIIEHHGGRIWLQSKVRKGSTFSFAIPFVPAETKSKRKEKPIHLNELVKQLREQMVFSQLKLDGKHATILIVDDDDSIRSLLEQELGEAGYIIEQATNGKEALECIRKNRPDLIILDVMMPEINGFDVAAILKNDPQTMDIPIIILSIIQDKARGFRIGVDRYLTKPIDTAQLFQEVGNLLEQGKSKKKVMVVDEDSEAVRTLTDVLQTKGYQVVESDGKELVKKAIATQPDIIILNSIFSSKQEIVKTLRFEKGLENVLFFIYQ